MTATSAPASPAVSVCTLSELETDPAWRQAFAQQRKDFRYFKIVEESLHQDFEHRYFRLRLPDGETAIQPFFIHDQDLLAGSPMWVQKWMQRLRRVFPRLLKLRTLMVGCAAGEGRIDADEPDSPRAIAIGELLAKSIKDHSRRLRCGMIVFKEFPSDTRKAMRPLTEAGFTRVPSLPMTRLNIDYPSFDDYMTKALSKATRKSLRRKFRDAEEGEPITFEMLNDVTDIVDQVHPLYIAVYERSKMHFEKLTKEFLSRLGREMPDKVRFFIWRRAGKIVAFSICMIAGENLFDEYVGLDYSVALDLHLYFFTLRDIFQWGMQHGFKRYFSTALCYDPKLHLKCTLDPLDLYVAHTSGPINWILSRVLPWLEPTRNDKTLREFPNFADLWGDQ
jgi:Acetyltransferase (GNAT) domain